MTESKKKYYISLDRDDKIFTDIEYAKEIRKKFDMDKLDRLENVQVTIFIPDTNATVSNSFVLALFLPSFKYLGDTMSVLDKYHIKQHKYNRFKDKVIRALTHYETYGKYYEYTEIGISKDSIFKKVKNWFKNIIK